MRETRSWAEGPWWNGGCWWLKVCLRWDSPEEVEVRVGGTVYSKVVLMRQITVMGLAAVMALGSGCATMFRGKDQRVKFVTEPEGAVVTVNEVQQETPVEVVLKRKQKHQVSISKEGYRTVNFELKGRWDGTSMLSFLLPGGTLWFLIDTGSGADKTFGKLEVIRMQPTTNPSEPPVTYYVQKGKFYTEEEYKKLKGKEPTTKPAEEEKKSGGDEEMRG